MNIIAEFADHLKANGYGKSSIGNYTRTAQQFLTHIGNRPIDRVSEAETRTFFERYKKKNRQPHAVALSAFLKFAMKGLPAVVDDKNATVAHLPANKKQTALKAKWTLDKLIAEKEKTDDLLALLGRKVIDHYMHFERRLQGQSEDLDEIARFADECKDLIQANLPLFMQMSAAGRNVHSRIDARVL